MNILIFGNDSKLVRYIPFHSISCIKWKAENGKGGYEINSRCEELYAVGNSARKLAHAITSKQDQVELNANEVMGGGPFSRWCQTEPTEAIGCLPEARMPLIRDAA